VLLVNPLSETEWLVSKLESSVVELPYAVVVPYSP
jgi:hypothetical protein